MENLRLLGSQVQATGSGHLPSLAHWIDLTGAVISGLELMTKPSVAECVSWEADTEVKIRVQEVY